MNAPAAVTVPPSKAGMSTMPFNLQLYAEGEFDKLHAAGSMLVSASNVPAIFNAVPQRYGKLTYAMHLTGQKSLPDLDDIALIKIGHLLEPLAAEMLAEQLGVDVIRFDAYSRHPWLPLFATPDAVAWIDDVPHIVEIKTVSPRVWAQQWQDGPPLHVALQHQAQLACTGARAGIIASLSPAYGSLDFWFTAPDQPTIDKIELGVDSLIAMIERGDMPEPDDTEADAEAFRSLMWQSDAEKVISIEGEEAVRRAKQYQQAKDDETAATRMITAQKRWFQSRMGDAQIANIDDGGFFEWKTNKTKPKDQDRPSRIFKFKEAKDSK